MIQPASADAWLRLTARGILHYLSAGERTTPCGIPSRPPTERLRASDIDKLPDYERPKRCHTCLTAARKEGHR